MNFWALISKEQCVYIKKHKKPATQENLPPVVTFNETLPFVKNVIDKHWHIVSINKKFKKTFDKKSFIGCRRNKNLQQIIGGNRIL